MTPESGLGVEWNIRAKWKNAGNAFEDMLMAAVALGHITQCFHFNRKSTVVSASDEHWVFFSAAHTDLFCVTSTVQMSLCEHLRLRCKSDEAHWR